MTLIATIHTTDIDQMAELVAAAKHHGPVELRYVDGGHHGRTPLPFDDDQADDDDR